MSKLVQELKRRNVFKETIAYLIVAWLILQVVALVLPIWNAPAWILQVTTITLAIGLPIWIIFSWHYQITSSGIKRTKWLDDQNIKARSSRILNATIMVALVAVIILIWIRPSMVTNIPTQKLSIAVLPFTNMSNDESNEWFSIGVTEDILTHLSKIEGLRVISRTSVMQYKDTDKSLPEIANELDVSYIVEGSVRKQNDRVLITAQLLNANDEHLWADNYDEDLVDAFVIQQDVSKKIVSELKIYVSPEEKHTLNTATTKNPIALELFARGRSIADTRTKENIEQSIDLYEEAIKLDPSFAEAYAEIANSYMLRNTYGGLSLEEATDKANVYVAKALELNSNISRPYSVLAFTYLYNDWEKAKYYFEKALEINPNDATAHHHFALYFRDSPNPDAKNLLKHMTEAQRLDPFSRPVSQMTFMALLVNNKIEKAKTHLEKTKFLYRPEEIIHYEGLLNSVIKKDLTELIYSFERALKDDPDNLHFLGTLSAYYTWILLDRNKSLQFSKRMNEINPADSKYILDRLYNFYATKKFEEAKKVLNDSVFEELLNPFQKKALQMDYYAHQGNYEKALPYLEQLKPINLQGYYYNKAWIYSKKGDAKTTYEVLNNTDYNPSDFAKVLCFAHLKEADSLFYYLHKISNYAKLDYRNYSIMVINGGFAIDPYRKDPRYIEILKRNYFPVEKQKN